MHIKILLQTPLFCCLYTYFNLKYTSCDPFLHIKTFYVVNNTLIYADMINNSILFEKESEDDDTEKIKENDNKIDITKSCIDAYKKP